MSNLHLQKHDKLYNDDLIVSGGRDRDGTPTVTIEIHNFCTNWKHPNRGRFRIKGDDINALIKALQEITEE